MWVTPNYQDTDFAWPLTIEDKITIFLDRTYGWQLDIADQCINGRTDLNGKTLAQPIDHSGFAVLNIVLSYFEMIAKYQDGFMTNGKSEYYFKQGVYSVFPHLKAASSSMTDSLLNILYFGARCGLYHSGMTDERIIVTGETAFPMVLDMPEARLKINPRLLVPALKAHLLEYGRQLRQPQNNTLRKNFEHRFDFDALKSCSTTDSSQLNRYTSNRYTQNRYTITPPEQPVDLLKHNLKVVFCSIAASGKALWSSIYYPDNRNRFWNVLHRIGLTPRLFAPNECKSLPKYGIGLTALLKGEPGGPGSFDFANMDVQGLQQKISRLKPKTVAFNGKHAAQEFFGCPVHYGMHPEPVAGSTVFVLPSTSGVARKYWNEKYWRELAEFVKSV